jgi:hypothetical protein
LGDDIYAWRPNHDELQSVRLTSNLREVLKNEQGVDFDPTGYTSDVSANKNLTLYGLQTMPTEWLEYDTKTQDVVYRNDKNVKKTVVVNNNNNNNNRPASLTVDGKVYYPMTLKHTGLESSGKILYYLGESKPDFKAKKEAQQSATKLSISDANVKQISDRITADNVRLWEPITTRSMSQRSVMGNVSAADEAATLGMTEGNWQWCHLIAHSMGTLGNPQVPRNLVAGTAACNGAMAHLEMAIKKFVKSTSMDLRVTVTAHLIPPTHVASSIKYEVENLSGQKEAVFHFEPLNPNKSATQHADFYASTLVDGLAAKNFDLASPERSKMIQDMTGGKHFETPVRSNGNSNSNSSSLPSSPFGANLFQSPKAQSTATLPKIGEEVVVTFRNGTMSGATVTQHKEGNNYLLSVGPQTFITAVLQSDGSFVQL